MHASIPLKINKQRDVASPCFKLIDIYSLCMFRLLFTLYNDFISLKIQICPPWLFHRLQRIHSCIEPLCGFLKE